MQRTSANRCRGERHKVAVIGAGAAGLAAARELLRSGHEVVVFEASRRVGGLWNAPPQGASEALPPSAVYDHLRTNLPRAVMAFRDFPFTDRETDPGAAADPLRASAHPLSFPHHSAVRAYLRRFAGEHDLLRHVRWGARIKHVELPGCGSADGGSSPGAPEFRLTLERQRAAEAFDAVAVCNGHFSEPFTPDLEGLSGFAGEVLHSQSYRRPERFTGRRVAVIGAQSSGLDLAHALLEVAAEVHLFASNPTELTVAAGITLHGAARGFEGAAVRSVRGHAGGEEHRVEVDTVIFCTGYRYSFPFLPKGCVELGRGSVKPLYLDCLHALQPRMAFVGLPFKVVPFPQFELQGKLFARTLSGELPLPGGGKLYSLARDHYRSLDASGVTQGLCHGARQFAYAAELCTLLGEPLWPAWFAPVYDAVGRARARFPSSYRDRFPDLARSVWEGAPDSRAVTAAAGFPLRPKPRSLR